VNKILVVAILPISEFEIIKAKFERDEEREWKFEIINTKETTQGK
jgi:hypothetical protein